MRTLLVLVAVVLRADGGSPSPAGRPAAYAAARRAFARAIGAGALDEAREALGRRRAAAPGRIDVQYDLACLEARAGRTDRAFEVLTPLASAGLAVDLSEDPDLRPLRTDARWTPLVERFAAGRSPVRPGPTRAIPPELGLVEDLAEDARTGAVFVSSVRTGQVWRGVGGAWRAWAHPAPAGSGAFALGLDARRRVLHVSVDAVPQAEGFRTTDEGRSALVTYRLDDATEIARREPPADGPHLLGDITVTSDGAVLVSDALAGTVYRLAPDGGVLEPLVPAHTFASPQTPALAPDGRTLLVPDWTLGLFAMPVGGGVPEPVLGPGDLVTGGIDGLTAAPGGVVAVQNGIVQPRVVRLWLTPDGRRVTRWTVLSRAPELGDPTHAVATRRGVLALVDSGWGRFADDGTLRPGAPPAHPALLPLDLH
ncbi:MAG TPA: hypothetical protein VMT11_02570 [Myxococcaceae bacterium]|nr:hypothetical protein [Myxococcaceae bacterium]